MVMLMKILSVPDLQKLIQIIGVSAFFKLLINALQEDFSRWHDFYKSPRQVIHYPHGVIELMPCADDYFHAFKYVNGHPKNTASGKLSVVALGQLSDVESGYPLIISEMTLLTAFRTAASAALAAKYLARDNSSTIAIIGTGAQSEFQVLGLAEMFPVETIRYFDKDLKAMHKFANNLTGKNFQLSPCQSIAEAVDSADLVITATALKQRQCLFGPEQIAPGTHINAIGGDCPGKTELPVALLNQAKIVVEFSPQSHLEGEVQQCDIQLIYAELWELVAKHKPGRVNNHEITLFDSVGFALEDYSALRVVYQLAQEYQMGTKMPLIPDLKDPKDLFGLLRS